MPRRRRPNSTARGGSASAQNSSGPSSTASTPSITHAAIPRAAIPTHAHDSRPPRVSAGSSRPITRGVNTATPTRNNTVGPPPGFEDRAVRRSQTLASPTTSHRSNTSVSGEQQLEWGHLLPEEFQRLDPTLDDAVSSTSTTPSIGVIGDRRGSAPEFGQGRAPGGTTATLAPLTTLAQRRRSMPASSTTVPHILTPRDPLPMDVPVPVLVPRCVDYRYPDRPVDRQVEQTPTPEEMMPRRPPMTRAFTVPTVHITSPPQSAPLHPPTEWSESYTEEGSSRWLQRSQSMVDIESGWSTRADESGWTRGTGSSRQTVRYPVTNNDYGANGYGSNGGDGYGHRGQEGWGWGPGQGLQRTQSEVQLQGRDEFGYIEEEREQGEHEEEQRALFRQNERGIWYMDRGGSWT